MTEPSQYFKGRTVQEQMNEVIGYVDARAEEVAAAKADDVLEPAEQAKDDAIAAKEAAEDARDTTLAALPAIQQDITDLKAEDVALDGRLDTVELKVQTAEGNIVTIQGQIVALQTADGQNVKLTGANAIGNYAVLLTDNQSVYGDKRIMGRILERVSYVKNTVGSTTPIPIFKMSDLTRDNRYMKTSLFISGRTTPTTITEVVWNDTTLTKTDILGTQTNPFTIMSDTEGHYWLCMSIVANNTVNAFVLDCIRNAGYDEPVYPLIIGETPDMTGWTVVVSQ